MLLQDKRIDPSVNNNYVLDFIKNNWSDNGKKTNIIKLLLENARVQSVIDR